MSTTSDQLVTLKEVAEYLNVSENHVRNMMKKKEIPFIAIGGIYRFDLQEIRESLTEKLARKPRPSKTKVSKSNEN